MNRGYLGIDNGVTGSLAYVGPVVLFAKTPVHKEQSYTKKKQQITRIDFDSLVELLRNWGMDWRNGEGDMLTRVFIERPFVNPKGFRATASALRCLEATLIAVESEGLSYQYIDSREWQKAMLPSGIKGPELKYASVDIGCRLFPQFVEEIRKHKDADSLLIAEYARRNQL